MQQSLWLQASEVQIVLAFLAVKPEGQVYRLPPHVGLAVRENRTRKPAVEKRPADPRGKNVGTLRQSPLSLLVSDRSTPMQQSVRLQASEVQVVLTFLGVNPDGQVNRLSPHVG